jgi:uncharacterized damage-inducible protein DinB
MIETMFRYNHDINAGLLELSARLTPEQWNAPQDAGQRSLHQTLFHILAVEEEYLSLIQNGLPIWETQMFDSFPDPASLARFNEQLYTTYLPLFESLTEERLTSKITCMMPSGRVETVMVWHILIHMLYHSAQHRSECAFRLTQFGQSPGFIDFYGYGDWGKA